MPYIKKENRIVIDKLIQPIIDFQNRDPETYPYTLTSGDLNYMISKILWLYFKKSPCYSTVNTIVGVLECIKLEFYTRLARPYEDKKIVENGDIV